IALRGQETDRRHPLTATAYGSGAALIVDELALLIDLQDVYWAREGRRSVDAAIGMIAAGGVYLTVAPFWHRAAREVVYTGIETASTPLPSPVPDHPAGKVVEADDGYERGVDPHHRLPASLVGLVLAVSSRLPTGIDSVYTSPTQCPPSLGDRCGPARQSVRVIAASGLMTRKVKLSSR